MPRFGSRSRRRLDTCHPDLQRLFNKVVVNFDCSVLCGHRNEEDQNKAYDQGRSKVKYPNGRHNATPSNAVEVAPYPIDWEDRDRFNLFAGYVLGIAQSMGLDIRWGGDWDQDFQVKDNNFDDLPHFELRKK